MAVTAISIDEAFAQGSSSPQMMSVARYHRDEAGRLLKLARNSAAAMAPWKAKKFKQEVDESVRTHHDYAEHFEALASRMKSIEEAARQARTETLSDGS